MNGHEKLEHGKLNNRPSIQDSEPAGLLALLHPYPTPDTPASHELQPPADRTVEMRKRVNGQIAKLLPATFSNDQHGFKFTLQSVCSNQADKSLT